MMILAIDTATRWTGLALHDGTNVIAEYGWRAVNTQTIELAPAVQLMWQRAGIQPGDLNTSLKAVAVAIGPGSYTGLRVGLGFAKGLALTLPIALIGVPTLDIVAAAVPKLSGRLVVVAEAGRTRVCAAPYTWQRRKGWQPDSPPAVKTWEALLADYAGQITFAGETVAGQSRRIRAADKQFQVLPATAGVRRAGYLAQIGVQRLKQKQTDDPAALTPFYLQEPAGA